MQRKSGYLIIFYLYPFCNTHAIYMGQKLNQSPNLMPHQTNVYLSYKLKSIYKRPAYEENIYPFNCHFPYDYGSTSLLMAFTSRTARNSFFK